MAPPLWAQHALSAPPQASASSHASSSSGWQAFEPLLPASSSAAPLSRPAQRSRPRSFRLTSPAVDAASTRLSPADVVTLVRALRLAHLEPGPVPAAAPSAADAVYEPGAAATTATATAEALFIELATCMLPSHSAAWLLDVVRQSSWAPASSHSSANELLIPAHATLSSLPVRPRTSETGKRERKPAAPPGLAPALAPVPVRMRRPYGSGRSSGGMAVEGKQSSEEAEVERALLASADTSTGGTQQPERAAEREKRRRASGRQPAGPRPQPPVAPADGQPSTEYEAALRVYESAMETWTRRKAREERRAKRKEERRRREEREEHALRLQKQAPDDDEDEWQDISSTSTAQPHASTSHTEAPPLRASQKPFNVYNALPAHIKARLPKRGRGRPSNEQRRVWEEELFKYMTEQGEEVKGEGFAMSGERERALNATSTHERRRDEVQSGHDSSMLQVANSSSRAHSWTSASRTSEEVVSGPESGLGSGYGSGYGTPLGVAGAADFDAMPRPPPFASGHLQEPWQHHTSARSESTPASFASAHSGSIEPALDPSLEDAPTSQVEEASLSAAAASAALTPGQMSAPAPAAADVHLHQQPLQQEEPQIYNFAAMASSPRAAASAVYSSVEQPPAHFFADSTWRATTPDAPMPAPLPPLGGGWTSSPMRAVTPEPPAPWLSPEYAAQQPRFTPLRPRPAPPVFAPASAASFGSPRVRSRSSNSNSSGSGSALTTAQWLARATQMAQESEMPYIHAVDDQRMAASKALAGPSSPRAHQRWSGAQEPPAKRAKGRPPKQHSLDETEAKETASRLPLLPNARDGVASQAGTSSGTSARRPGRPSGSRKPAAAAPAVPLRGVTTRSRRGGPAPKMPLPTFWLTPAQRAEKARQRRMAALAQVAEQPVGETAEGSEREKSPSMQEMLASFAEEINAE